MTALPYSACVVPPQARFLGEQSLADVQSGAAARVLDVLVDGERAVNELQQLVRVDAKRAAIAARDWHVEATQEIVHRGAEENLR